MNPESIYYLFETGTKARQEDYIWPLAGKATVNDKVFIVCDGSGSFYAGEVASELICRFMAAKVSKFGEQRMSGELIDELLVESRDRLITYARDYRLDTDLATTFSMLILYDQRALISWCGDSPIYHIRGGEILFRTNDDSIVSEPSRHSTVARGIKADSSPIYTETKWIEDVRDGDYFLLCNKVITESIKDEDIKLLVSQNEKSNLDLSESFGRLAFEKTQGNYSMYLIRVRSGTQKRRVSNGIGVIRKKSNGLSIPMVILAITGVLFLIMVIYFKTVRTSTRIQRYTNQTTRPVEVMRDDSVPSAIVISTPPKTAPAVTEAPKPAPTVTDSIKSNSENPKTIPRNPVPIQTNSKEGSSEKPKAAPRNDKAAIVPAEVKPVQTNEKPISEKKRVAELMIKLSTDESCKLEIRNIDLDQVFQWDLSPNDDGAIYLKPGKYSIIATSVTNSSRSKTYKFEVKPQSVHASQNLHISF